MICEQAIDPAPFMQVFPSSYVRAGSLFNPSVPRDSGPQSIKQRLYRGLKREAEVVSWASRGHIKVFSALSAPPWGQAIPGELSGRLKVCVEERNRKQENENEKRKEGKGRKTEMEVTVAGGQTHALTMTAVALQCCPQKPVQRRGDVVGDRLCLSTWASFPYSVHSF